MDVIKVTGTLKISCYYLLMHTQLDNLLLRMEEHTKHLYYKSIRQGWKNRAACLTLIMFMGIAIEKTHVRCCCTHEVACMKLVLRTQITCILAHDETPGCRHSRWVKPHVVAGCHQARRAMPKYDAHTLLACCRGPVPRCVRRLASRWSLCGFAVLPRPPSRRRWAPWCPIIMVVALVQLNPLWLMMASVTVDDDLKGLGRSGPRRHIGAPGMQTAT